MIVPSGTRTVCGSISVPANNLSNSSLNQVTISAGTLSGVTIRPIKMTQTF